MAQWDETMAINVRGVILCAKHAVPMLKRQGGALPLPFSGSAFFS